MTQSPFLINPHLRKQNYDPLIGFEPICQFVNSPTVIVVNGTSAYRSLGDLLSAARAPSSNLSMAGNPASVSQIGLELLKLSANINMTFVPYTGAGPQVTALLGDHVTAAFAAYTAFSDHIKSGRLRALASLSRIEAAPDVPTFAELGFSELEFDAWTGLLAPAKTPNETLAQLGAWFVAAMHEPEIKLKLAALQLSLVNKCGFDFAALLRKQHEQFGRIIREANIKPE
jgi:tripartite-type tricarboxylate transporter receptor subunit TctC